MKKEMDKLEGLTLYQAERCPYCVRVRHFLDQRDREIEIRDVFEDPSILDELMSSTGSTMVPCLRIEETDGEVRWLHESADIINFLDRRISAT